MKQPENNKALRYIWAFALVVIGCSLLFDAAFENYIYMKVFDILAAFIVLVAADDVAKGRPVSVEALIRKK